MAKLRDIAMKNPGTDFTARVRQYAYELQQLERDIGRVIHIGASSTAPVPTTNEGWAVWTIFLDWIEFNLGRRTDTTRQNVGWESKIGPNLYSSFRDSFF